MASHVDKLPIATPIGIEVKIEGQNFSVEGAKGSNSCAVPEGTTAAAKGNEIVLTTADDLRPTRTKHDLVRSIMADMIKGVYDDYSKTLEIVGTGYHAAAKGQGTEFFLGYSHTITVNPPEGITLKVADASHVVIGGTSEQIVGQVAANIHKLRASESYKGKDIKYSDERALRKAGKTGK